MRLETPPSIAPYLRGSALTLLLGASALLALPFAAEARKIYTSGTSSAKVIDSTTNTVKSISIGTGAGRGIAITPDGTRVYVANNTAKTVSVIDTSNDSSVLATIPVAHGPDYLAVAPDGGHVYTVDPDATNGEISVIDTQANTVVNSIAIGAFNAQGGIAISPDGAHLYVADVGHGDGRVEIFSTATNSASGEIIGASGPDGLGGGATSIAITPDGKQAFVGDFGSWVATVDLATNTVTGRANVGSSGATTSRQIAISPDGARAYVTNRASNTVSVVDTVTNAVTTVSGFSTPTGIAEMPSGASVYVANSGASTASILDTGANTIVTPISGLSGPWSVAIVPDQGPTANFKVAKQGSAGSATSFDASASSDDESISNYSWAYGDGGTSSSSAATSSHTYAKAGPYNATLTVTDNLGTSTQQVFTGQTVLRNGSSKARKTVAVSVAPAIAITKPKKNQRMRRRKFTKIAGTTVGPGVSKVEYSLTRNVRVHVKGKRHKVARCRFLSKKGKLGTAQSCAKTTYLRAKGTTSWSAKIKKRLPKGKYTLYARVVSSGKVVSGPETVTFTLT